MQPALIDPIEALAAASGVLAAVTGVEGSAFRPVGAVMAFLRDGSRVGSLSSGCIEDALSLEADKAWAEDEPRKLRYGDGSPWIDIKLPCGAGLDVQLWPVRDNSLLAQSAAQSRERRPHALRLPFSGLETTAIVPLAHAGAEDTAFLLPRIPALQCTVFGTGLETIVFAEIARAAGYRVHVSSPDPVVTSAIPDAIPFTGVRTETAEAIDEQTAVALFFHDHAFETELLQSKLQTPAFWIGAQGSARAQKARRQDLQNAGIDQAAINRLQSRFGLIPSARDPQTLAISVLADMVEAYKAKWFDPFFGSPQKEAA